ncbi:hypothetical protein jaqu_08680 [Jannaschia aquimarina]|uniref:CcoQ/FixQ family Cbb3-type cytochrome c oxidase assembly chaperone n=2 Tax=Jannaschia aquimarina TaxID=935700 RepID=A0A0D1EIF3_9RHOB|nr:hypothetical protein jaqu_08680 [Jannaschia aquimarina]SNS45756.1 hypothetical protein SAMN05421775_10118 [Jannaschia aquimarina]
MRFGFQDLHHEASDPMSLEIFLAGFAGIAFVTFLIFVLTGRSRLEEEIEDARLPRSARAKKAAGTPVSDGR